MNQDAVIAFLADPATHDGAPVERIDTHISVIFLAGERAYKLKRAVTLPFLDFSTLQQRETACWTELAINRRTAPALYLAVEPVMRDSEGLLHLGGTGMVVDWVVVMRRFDDSTLFDRLAARGALTEGHARDLADAVARFHHAAERQPNWGGAAGVRHTIATNQACFDQRAGHPFDPAQTASLTAASLAWLAQLTPRLESRRQNGSVRRCHGDLHLGNIFLADGQPTLFDAIEFNDDFACIDSFYDLAFLLMDLRAKALPELSCLVFNRYLEQMGDFGALAALPLFLSLRAAIRSHVSATMAQEDAVHRLKLLADAQSYLDQAIVYLAPKAPRLVACGGLSGSGKSQLARGLAPRLGPAPGALVLRSDVLRKRLMGVAPECRLSGDAYSAAMTERTYAALTEQAAAALADGHSVIADAVFARPDQRLAIESVAQQAGVPFHGVWLAVDAAVLRARVEGRIGDASDATAAVVDQQLTYEVGPITWTTIGSSGPVEATLAAACRLIPL